MVTKILSGALEKFFNQNPTVENQSHYAIGVSGGADSMALAHGLITHYPDKQFHLITVDHGLRPEASGEAKKVSEIFLRYENATHVILEWTGDKPTSAVLEEARTARYDLMDDYCTTHNIQTIFLGHHQDDQAETFLIRLSKGSGLDGLTAMNDISKRADINLARPFLSVSKEDLVSYCDTHKIDFVDDPTNTNTNYMRPRLRDAMAVLSKEGLTPKRLSITAKRLQRARKAILHYTEDVKKQAIIKQEAEKIILDFTLLLQAPSEISFRILQNLIEGFRNAYDYNVRMEKLEDLHESLMGDPQSFKPRTLGGCLISLKNKQLIVEKEKK